MAKYAEGAQEIAKDKKLHLVVLEINGRHAKKGSVTFSGPVGPETMRKVWNLFAELSDAKARLK